MKTITATVAAIAMAATLSAHAAAPSVCEARGTMIHSMATDRDNGISMRQIATEWVHAWKSGETDPNNPTQEQASELIGSLLGITFERVDLNPRELQNAIVEQCVAYLVDSGAML